MSYGKAIVIGAGLLAGLAGVAALGGSAATYEGGKRFAVAASGEGAWRVDTYTGRMVWCHVEAPAAAPAEGPSVLRGSGGRRVVCFDADGKVDVKLF